MRLRTVFDYSKQRSPRTAVRLALRSAARRRPAAGQLQLEALEDRCLLSFNLVASYPAGTSPQGMLAADFNGDSRLDLAVANYSSSNVSILRGNADGTFQPAQDSATGAGPRSLAVGDFNGDGKLDLATANASNVSVLLGNGSGTFQVPSSIDIGSNPASVAVGDFNGDGKLDLGVTSNLFVDDGCGYYGCYSHYEGRANVLLGNGAGSFSAPSISSLGFGQPTATAVGHFNADSNLDFATASADSISVGVLLGTGTGTLGAPIYFSAAPSQSMAAADVDGDGKLDLVTANRYGGTVSVLLGTSAGSFGAAQNYAAGSAPGSVAMADFNGDGKADLVTGDADSGTVGVLLGTGIGTFKPPVNAAVGVGSAGLAVGDFNGDGRPDAASANSGSNTVSALLNDGSWPALDAPSVTIGDAAAVTEGNTATVSATFTVSLSAAYSQTVSVQYSTADGTATLAGSDYQPTSGAVTFAPGEMSKTVSVLVNGDRLVENSESFYVRLTNPTNAFVADATGALTILDDEPFVSIVDNVSGSEENTGTTAFTFTVTLSAAYDAPVTVDYATADLTPDDEYWYGPGATAGVDYTAASGIVTFAIGDTSETITVLVTGDRVGEADELFFVNLSNPTIAQLSTSQALGSILNDEPYVGINSTSGVEGNSGATALTFTVTLSAASTDPVTVNYATADASATVASGDYQATTDETVTFDPGVTSQTITVLVNGDRLGENDESFTVNLSGATGALISSGTGYGTIMDNEPRISINSMSLKERRRGTKLMTFTVTLSAAYDQPVTIDFVTQDSSATVAGNDYVAKSGSLTFAAGETTKTVSVAIKGDKKREANETFYILLSGASTDAFISNAYGWGSILNDDRRRR